MCNNALPSLANMCLKKVVKVMYCPRCRQAKEYVSHTMWWCVRWKEVWVSTPFWGMIARFKWLGSRDVLRGLAELLKKKLYDLWMDRNDFVHNGNGRQSRNLVSCMAIQSSYLGVSSPNVWSPPQVGSLKLNTNASVKKGLLLCGVGAVIKDDKGWVVTALSKPFPSNFSTEAGEMVALREGLLLAQKLQLKVSCVELDACNVVSKISNGLADLGEIEFILDDVKALLKAVEVQKCLSISRNGNRVAHNLTSLTLSSKEDLLWQNICLSVIFPCLVG
ncbi:hypothetical protein Dsin_010793 [Dipteronia sinensis]|uniref:RNase H type-1 domain-containing protein n=1 Tax=Dipteronia sinensis TaxID=43782 RepID=A0AAE0AT72_9ROSI|nr:hypothetical protein Dsin_010793 [Dipteronia sinensis]